MENKCLVCDAKNWDEIFNETVIYVQDNLINTLNKLTYVYYSLLNSSRLL